MRRALRPTASKQLLVVAVCALAVGCEVLETELPTEVVVSLPDLSWQSIPPEHEAYAAEMVELLDRIAADMERRHAKRGRYDDVRLHVDLPEGMTVYVSAGGDHANVVVRHVDAPGSGCVVRLGVVPLIRYTDEPTEQPTPAFQVAGLRLPDEPGRAECMQTRSAEELRPRVTRRRL